MKPPPPHVLARRLVLLLICLCATASCQLIAPFSEEAYRQATSLKVESLELMDKADQPFAQHVEQVAALRSQLEKAYEYAAGRPKNDLSTKQWSIMKDPNRHLMGGFLKRWETEDHLGTVFIQEASGNISDAFDQIIGLESGKIKPEQN